MDYSIVVTTMWDNVDCVINCLKSIISSDLPDNTELILILNDYSDEAARTVRVFESFMDNIHECLGFRIERSSFAEANNIGVDLSKGAYTILLNDDTTVKGDWIQQLRGQLHDNIICVGPQTADLDVLGKHTHREETKPIVDYVALCCAMFPRDIFMELGKLDEGYTPAWFEDTDFGVRLMKAGYKSVHYVPDGFNHVGGATMSKLSSAERHAAYSKNYHRFMSLHGDWLREREERGVFL